MQKSRSLSPVPRRGRYPRRCSVTEHTIRAQQQLMHSMQDLRYDHDDDLPSSNALFDVSGFPAHEKLSSGDMSWSSPQVGTQHGGLSLSMDGGEETLYPGSSRRYEDAAKPSSPTPSTTPSSSASNTPKSLSPESPAKYISDGMMAVQGLPQLVYPDKQQHLISRSASQQQQHHHHHQKMEIEPQPEAPPVRSRRIRRRCSVTKFSLEMGGGGGMIPPRHDSNQMIPKAKSTTQLPRRPRARPVPAHRVQSISEEVPLEEEPVAARNSSFGDLIAGFQQASHDSTEDENNSGEMIVGFTPNRRQSYKEMDEPFQWPKEDAIMQDQQNPLNLRGFLGSGETGGRKSLGSPGGGLKSPGSKRVKKSLLQSLRAEVLSSHSSHL